MDLKAAINTQNLPQHVAIIMDGNGRWAKKQGKLRTFGHKHGVEAVRDTVEAAAELGVKYLTLYAFSTENWNRPKLEIDMLMELLIKTIHAETKTLNNNNIRLQAIGHLASLPKKCQQQLNETITNTANNSRMTLVLALSYSAKWEITQAVKQLAVQVAKGELVAQDISETTISNALTTANMPDPELLIRTSGEYRISNFLLWQIAYAVLYFCQKLWPDFRRNDFYEAIIDYQKRERRFGGVKS